MKKIFLIISIILVCFSSLRGQSGFRTGSYYDQEYYIEDIPVGYPHVKYDYYGRYAGTYQTWKKARWYNSRGGHYIYVWSGSGWLYQWINGYYYWFDWATYEVSLGY